MGDALGFQQTGVLYLAKTDREIAGFEAWTEHARAHQLDTRLLTAGETLAMLKGAAAPWKGALFTASDARAEPWMAVPALAAAARGEGVVIRESCAVRALDLAGGPRGGRGDRGRADCLRPCGRRRRRLVAAVPCAAMGCSIPQLSVLATRGRDRTDAGDLPRQCGR